MTEEVQDLTDELHEVKNSFIANKKRLYVNNVSYFATEEDFNELLKDFEMFEYT